MLIYKKINPKQNAENGNEQAKQQIYEEQIKNLQTQIDELTKDMDPTNDRIENVFTEKNVAENGQERITKFLNDELFQWLINCPESTFNDILNNLNSLTITDEVQNDVRELKVLLNWVAKARSEKPKQHESVYKWVVQAINEGRLNNIDDVLKKGGYEKNMNNLLSFVNNDANYMDALYLISTMKDKVDQNPFMKMSSRDKESYNKIFNAIRDKYDLNGGDIKGLAKAKQLNLTMWNGNDSKSLSNLINKRSSGNTWKWGDLSEEMVVFAEGSENRLFNKTDFVQEFNKRNRIRTEKNNEIVNGVQSFNFSDDFKIDENFKMSDDGNKLMFKKEEKDGNPVYEEVTSENMFDIDKGMSFDKKNELDYLEAEKWNLFKDLCVKFCEDVKWKLNQINAPENSEGIELVNCKLTPQDLNNMEGVLGANMFIEKGDNNKITYNNEKMMNFLWTIWNNNFKEYWNLNRPKGNGKWRALVSATQILLGNSKVDGRWTAKMEIWSKIRQFQKQEKLSWNWRLTFETLSKIIESKSADVADRPEGSVIFDENGDPNVMLGDVTVYGKAPAKDNKESNA